MNRKKIAALLAIVSVLVTFSPRQDVPPFFTPCQQEDSTNCIWFADVRGNGQGQSFIDIEGETIYFTNVEELRSKIAQHAPEYSKYL